MRSTAGIFKGSMPELYADENMDWETYYRSYVNTYLQRDIRDLAQVADEMQFYNFMTIVAAQTSKPVVYEELASATGISAPTAKKMALYFGIVSYHCTCTALSQQCTQTGCKDAIDPFPGHRFGSVPLKMGKSPKHWKEAPCLGRSLKAMFFQRFIRVI